ncbi:uncharacterized protein LOC117177938 [Belonocnema kinseyi]|uniref:uncharacterized protein LOC117177938 n=1 Tax=Belonocnema kinseyi TaxID=2817044 RepID=UPI00143D5680|nr:uncharacterized protein LOC117177938 [Belonocnema kinseyi]
MYYPTKIKQAVLSVKDIPGENGVARLRGDESWEEETRLDELLKYYFDLDNIGVNLNIKSKNEYDHALITLSETTKFMGNYWETGLLWKENYNLNFESYTTAKKRLSLIEVRIDRDPIYAELYYKEVQRFIDMGYAVKVKRDAPRPKIWYLPHFGVYNINKPNKIRFVFDAAAKTNGVSFNDLLESGPDLLQNLVGVLLRFRQFEVGFGADTKDMYLRIKVKKEDQGAQRFLWRGKDRDKEPDVYEMTSLIFGAKSSPCSALYVQKKNAERYAITNSDASISIVRNSYMDDYLCSRRTESDSKKLIHDVIKINLEANFEMHGWVSNKPRILEDVVFKKQQSNEKEMRLFDRGGERVLGFGISWDDKLRDEEYAAWKEWISEISLLKECHIPRCYMSHPRESNIQLHVFCDASTTAYAAVAYLRYEYESGHISVSLVMAKSKVAPLKPMTIPRIELQAALVGARLAKFIQNEVEIKISKRFFWSDSSTVIQWIKSEPRKRQIYVANRLGEISELTKSSEWFWVPTAENAADDATRFSNDATRENSRWFRGPKFLSLPPSEWPKDRFLSEEEKTRIDCLETRKANVFTIASQVSQIPLAMRLCGWRGLLKYASRTEEVRTRMAVYKWKVFAKKEKPRKTKVDICENYWKEIPKGSKIIGLRPYLDENGVLRAKGRVDFAPGLKFNNNPIVLDSKHFATKMLIQEYHRKFYHASSNAVLNELQQKYFIIGLRSALRSIIHKCLICRLRRGKPQNPLMGNLPEARLAVGQRPFSHCDGGNKGSSGGGGRGQLEGDTNHVAISIGTSFSSSHSSSGDSGGNNQQQIHGQLSRLGLHDNNYVAIPIGTPSSLSHSSSSDSDFGIPAKWHFYATAHGKGPCDGNSGNLKRFSALESFQASSRDQILTAVAHCQWAKNNFPKTAFFFSSKENHVTTAAELKLRFASANTIPGSQ